MIIQQHQSTAESSGFQGVNNFTIKASAKAFRILSDNIYKNKIAAIIRELSTNAVDSHFDAKQTRPFEINLPDQLDPTFRIRDFGTGLAHDQVMHLYTTYFESTKDKSNDYNGTLGLGSKAPFSYTNTLR
jgi:DNA topoisomerase VI subunit B